jgi:hypothetical protein
MSLCSARFGRGSATASFGLALDEDIGSTAQFVQTDGAETGI